MVGGIPLKDLSLEGPGIIGEDVTGGHTAVPGVMLGLASDEFIPLEGDVVSMGT